MFYRYGSNTRTRNRDEFPRVFTDIVNNADRVEEIVRRQYPQLQAEAVRFALFQRLDYMLHIPISMMNKENEFLYAGMGLSESGIKRRSSRILI